jgi:nucleotide-binding universal stress UspA family protein
MKRILVPVDGSKPSMAAVETAGELAKKLDAEVFVLNVCNVTEIPGEEPAKEARVGGPIGGGVRSESHPSRTYDEFTRDALVIAEQSAEPLIKDGVKATTVGICGDPADVILETAKEKDVDLIVIGRRGLTGIKRFLMGSVSRKVVDHAPCSVLVVKRKE